jgi:hypothetical protein
MSEPGTTVALVLAGGGARGAYEVGALSVLLPELERRGQRPRILLGTSVGALNVGFLAAQAHVPADDAMRTARTIWEQIQWEQVARGPLSGASLRRLWQALCQMVGVHGVRLESLLDPAPLHATVRGWVDFARIQANVRAGGPEASRAAGRGGAARRAGRDRPGPDRDVQRPARRRPAHPGHGQCDAGRRQWDAGGVTGLARSSRPKAGKRSVPYIVVGPRTLR